jgi:hypothetical protein
MNVRYNEGWKRESGDSASTRAANDTSVRTLAGTCQLQMTAYHVDDCLQSRAFQIAF